VRRGTGLQPHHTRRQAAEENQHLPPPQYIQGGRIVAADALALTATALATDGPRALECPKSSAAFHEAGHCVIYAFEGMLPTRAFGRSSSLASCNGVAERTALHRGGLMTRHPRTRTLDRRACKCLALSRKWSSIPPTIAGGHPSMRLQRQNPSCKRQPSNCSVTRAIVLVGDCRGSGGIENKRTNRSPDRQRVDASRKHQVATTCAAVVRNFLQRAPCPMSPPLWAMSTQSGSCG
jgi:hypothetical protein